MKSTSSLFFLLVLTACQSTPPKSEPEGVWQWDNEEIRKKENSGEITSTQANHLFSIEKSKCKIEGLKVPIPPPSCTQAPKQNCSNLTGFSKGFCQGYTPKPNCDYSSVNEAKDAQFKVFSYCMSLSGWSRIWVPNHELHSKNIEENIEDVFKSMPELIKWRENDPEKWGLAKKLDNELAEDPKYKELTLRERLTLVVSKVKNSL